MGHYKAEVVIGEKLVEKLERRSLFRANSCARDAQEFVFALGLDLHTRF